MRIAIVSDTHFGDDLGTLVTSEDTPQVGPAYQPFRQAVGQVDYLILLGDMTHGHYFEAYWALASDWLLQFAADAVPLDTPGELNLQELVGLNLPLNQLACAGIGQARPLTGLVRTIQQEVEAGSVRTLACLLDRLEARILASRAGAGRVRRSAERFVLRWIKRWVLSTFTRAEPVRYSRLFMNKPQVRDRFRRYYRASLNEIEQTLARARDRSARAAPCHLRPHPSAHSVGHR